MIGRKLCLIALTLWFALEILASENDGKVSLGEIIKKYRTETVLEVGETEDLSPLFMTEAERQLAFANFDLLYPTRVIANGIVGRSLPKKPVDLLEITFKANNETYSIQSFLNSQQLMGLMVVQNNAIRFEYYAPGHTKESRWASFSITKSVTSMLVGAAIQDGYIDRIEDPVFKYLPRLKGSNYGESRIVDLLQMASGIAWSEDYDDPRSDVAIAGALNGISLTQYLTKLPIVSSPGTLFNYNTAETNLLGEVLRSAIGMSAAPFLSQKIWQPMGMEYDANWLLSSPYDRETGGCCISATLRDYAKLGLFALADGVALDGTRILPIGWMDDSVKPSAGYQGYGYQWWLYEDGRYSARGAFGQAIFIDPKSNLVIAAQGNSKVASGGEHHHQLLAALMALSSYFRSL